MDPMDGPTLRRWLREHPRADHYGDPLPDGAVGRIGTLRFRHSIQQGNGWISSVCFNPDGTLLAVAAKEDSRISLWEVPSGRLRHMLDLRPHGPVLAAHFSPDGRLLVSEACGHLGSQTVALWDVASGACLGWLPGEVGHCSRFSPDGALLATVVRAGLLVWQVASQQLLHHLEPAAGLSAFSPDGSLLAGADPEGVILWRMPAGDRLRRLSFSLEENCHDTSCQALVFSPDGRWLAVSRIYRLLREVLTPEEFKRRKKSLRHYSWDHANGMIQVFKPVTDLVLWDVASGERRFVTRTEYGAQRLAFSPDSSVLLSAHYGTQRGPCPVRAWKVPTGKRLWRVEVDFHREFVSTPDGRMVASLNQGVQLHDMQTGRLVRNLPTAIRGGNKLAISPTRPTCLAVAHYGGLIELLDTQTGRELTPLARHDWEIRALAFSANGTRIATFSCGTAILWEADTGRELARLTAPFVDPHLLCADDRLLVLVNSPGVVSVWEWATGRSWPALPEPMPGWATLWPGHDLLVVQSQDGTESHLYSTVSGQRVGTLPKGIIGIARDGGLFIVAETWERMHLWQWEPLRVIGAINLPLSAPGEKFYVEPVSPAFVFSPDGTTLACRIRHEIDYRRHGVRCWDIASGRLLSEAHFTAPEEDYGVVPQPVLGFGVDGRPLLAVPRYSYQDGQESYGLSLWDGQSGQRLQERSHGHDRIDALAFDPNGKTLAISCDTTVILWAL